MNEFAKAVENLICPSPETVVWHTPINSTRMQIVPHGHVVARKDKIKTRCGGPSSCKHCAEEKRLVDAGTHPYEVEK